VSKESKKSCPKCKFAGNEHYPNGFTLEFEADNKKHFHCPACGHWSIE
jgi:predicted RNA-binding Zn-ribbon protein involved in translation (DUF1610 family)